MIFKKDGHYLYFFEKKSNEKSVFAVLLDTTTYNRYNINSVLCILEDETILFSIQSSDIALNVTISTPVATYSAPSATPNSKSSDILTTIEIDTISVWTVITSISSNIANIFGYFDICKLIFGVFECHCIFICVLSLSLNLIKSE